MYCPMNLATSFDVESAHRHFAVMANKLAWDLVEKDSRSAEGNSQMIHTAHTALWHWAHVGEPIHKLQASCLLASAYVAKKEGPNSLITQPSVCD